MAKKEEVSKSQTGQSSLSGFSNIDDYVMSACVFHDRNKKTIGKTYRKAEDLFKDLFHIIHSCDGFCTNFHGCIREISKKEVIAKFKFFRDNFDQFESHEKSSTLRMIKYIHFRNKELQRYKRPNHCNKIMLGWDGWIGFTKALQEKGYE